MATLYWLGTADAVAQVSTVTVTGMDGTPANTTYVLTVGGHTISAAGDTNVTVTAAALVTAWNASTDVYFSTVTASSNAGVVTLTADTAGVPFVCTSSKDGGTGTIGSVTAVTASAGPNDWSTAANWSTGAVPVTNDDVIISDTAINICWGFAQSAVDLTSLRIMKSYTGKIGHDYRVFATSADGATTNTTEVEYRERYLNIESQTLDIGEHYTSGSPAGSSRICIDLDNNSCIIMIHDTASTSSEVGRPALRLLTNTAATTAHIIKAPGGVGWAVGEPGETSSIQKVSVGAEAGANTKVVIGSGTTILSFLQASGTNTLQSAGTVNALNMFGGKLTISGDFTVSTGNIYSGTVIDHHEKSGGNAWTTLNLYGGLIDATGSPEGRTWSTVNFYKPAQILADTTAITISTLNEQPNGDMYTLTIT